MAIGIGTLFFVSLFPLLPVHALHSDETIYMEGAMQNLAFLQGRLSAESVTFFSPNHPFAGEFLMGLFMLAEGHTFSPQLNVHHSLPKHLQTSGDVPLDQTRLTLSEVVSARTASLFIAMIGLIGLIYLGTRLGEGALAGIFGFLIAISAPGFIDISTMAMLDIYCAVFSMLSVVLLYWYIRGSGTALVASCAFLGLAIGSKLSLDPLAAAAVIAFTVIAREEKNRKRLLRLVSGALAALATFAITTPVVIIRLQDEINSLSSIGTRTGPASFSEQSLFSVGKPPYGIFSFQQPLVLMLYGIVTTLAVSMAILRWYGSSRKVRDLFPMTSQLRMLTQYLRDSPDVFFLMVTVAFCSMDLIFSPFIFEYGRNFQRLSLYVALSGTVSFAFVLGHLTKPRRILLATFAFAVVLPVDWAFLSSLFEAFTNGTFTYAAFVAIPTRSFFDVEVGVFGLLASVLGLTILVVALGASVFGIFARSLPTLALRPFREKPEGETEFAHRPTSAVNPRLSNAGYRQTGPSHELVRS